MDSNQDTPQKRMLVDDLINIRIRETDEQWQQIQIRKIEEEGRQHVEIEFYLIGLMQSLSGLGFLCSIYYLTSGEKEVRCGDTLAPSVRGEPLFLECIHMGVRFQMYYVLGDNESFGRGFWLSFLVPTSAESGEDPLWSRAKCFGDEDEGENSLARYMLDQLASVQELLNKSSALKQQNIETTQMVNKSFGDWLQESVEFRGKVKLYAVYPFSSEAGFGQQIAWIRDVDFDELDEESSDIYQLSVFPADTSQRNPSRNILPKGSVAFKQFTFTSTEELPPELKQQRYLQIKNCRREEVWVLRGNKLERDIIYISDSRYNALVATEEIPHAIIIDLFG